MRVISTSKDWRRKLCYNGCNRKAAAFLIGVERVEEYVFWAVTGAVGLLISALTFFVKRGMDKKDTRDKEQDKRITEVEDKLNNTINQMPFLYTLREDFIRSSAQQTQKLDQIITLLMKREEK